MNGEHTGASVEDVWELVKTYNRKGYVYDLGADGIELTPAGEELAKEETDLPGFVADANVMRRAKLL